MESFKKCVIKSGRDINEMEYFKGMDKENFMPPENLEKMFEENLENF